MRYFKGHSDTSRVYVTDDDMHRGGWDDLELAGSRILLDAQAIKFLLGTEFKELTYEEYILEKI